MCLYWSSWEKKQFRWAVSSEHWETSLSQVSLLPPTGQGTSAGWQKQPQARSQSFLAKDNRATGDSASQLKGPTTAQFLWKITPLGFPQLWRRPDWCCHTPPRFLFLNMNLCLCCVWQSHSLHVTGPQGSTGTEGSSQAALLTFQPLVSARGVDAFLKALAMGDEWFYIRTASPFIYFKCAASPRGWNSGCAEQLENMNWKCSWGW